MHEYILNIHMHTVYSDGHGTHEDIAEAALQTGIDAVIVSDHNVWVQGKEGWIEKDDKRVLMLVGEEVHDQAREPQKNHLLVIGAEKELAPFASKPQELIGAAAKAGGLTFLAHPVDHAAPKFGEDDLSWVDWDARGFTGIELWNGLSEFKSHLRSRPQALYYAYNLKSIASGPFRDTVQKWDELLSEGRKVVAIGGSDAHALPARMGPLKRTLFPYPFHFNAINTHILTEQPFSGSLERDKKLVMAALRGGHAFIGYDLPASTRGFRFLAHTAEGDRWMGDEIPLDQGATLQARLPKRADEVRILREGEIVKTLQNCDACVHHAKRPGAYRIEADLRYRGKLRAWIFSNPIYVR
jgi:hypothetical protein